MVQIHAEGARRRGEQPSAEAIRRQMIRVAEYNENRKAAGHATRKPKKRRDE
jgi:hypothetical protein